MYIIQALTCTLDSTVHNIFCYSPLLHETLPAGASCRVCHQESTLPQVLQTVRMWHSLDDHQVGRSEFEGQNFEARVSRIRIQKCTVVMMHFWIQHVNILKISFILIIAFQLSTTENKFCVFVILYRRLTPLSLGRVPIPIIA